MNDEKKKEEKLIKVTFEYDSGKKMYLEGEDAAKWSDDIDDKVVIAFVHGSEMEKHPWKESS